MAEKDFKRVESNVKKMLAQKAPTTEVDAYLAAEGYTPQSFASAVKTGGIERPGNALRAFAQGLSFNFADEIEAGARALASEGIGGLRSTPTLSGLVTGEQPKSRYEQELAAIRAGNEDYKTQYPVRATALEVGGAVAPAVVAPVVGLLRATPKVAAQAPSLFNQILRGAGFGAASGAVSGAGASEGDMADRGQGAVQGGGVGAVLGAAAPAVMAGGRALYEKGRDVFGRTGAAAERKADELVLKSLQRDRQTPSDIKNRAQNNSTLYGPKPETIADLAGANTRGRAAAAANVPGPTKEKASEFLTDRVRMQPNRMSGDIERGMGETIENTNKLVKDIVEQRSKDAAPLYEAAYAKAPIISNREIDEFLKKPQFKQAFARAQRIAELEGRELPQIYKLQYTKSGQLIMDADGLPMLGPLERAPDLQTLDYIKRGLDDVIGSGGQKGSLGRTELGALKKARREFMEKVDSVAPEEYKQARATFAGHSETIDAIEKGRKIFNLPENDWREVADEVAKMSPLEQQMFRRGVVDAARIRMNQASNEVGSAIDVTKVFGKKETMDRLRQAFPDDESFNVFKSNLERESQFAQTRNQVITGSRTAPLAQDIADTNALMPSAAEGGSLLRGNPLPMLYGAAQRVVSNRLQGVTGDTAEILGDKLLGLQNPRAIGQYMDDLIKRQMQIDDELARRATSRGLVSVGAGNLGGLLGAVGGE